MRLIEIYFPGVGEEVSELLVAELSSIGFESFWLNENALIAYSYETFMNAESLKAVAFKYDCAYEILSLQAKSKSNFDVFNNYSNELFKILKPEGAILLSAFILKDEHLILNLIKH